MSGKRRGNQFNLESTNGFHSLKSQSKVQNKKKFNCCSHNKQNNIKMCIHCSPKNRVLHHEISSFLILANLSTDKIKADDVLYITRMLCSFHSDNVKLLQGVWVLHITTHRSLSTITLPQTLTKTLWTHLKKRYQN